MARSIFDNMMDAERLLGLHQTKPSIVDNEGSKPLEVVQGEVCFKNVSFTYDGRKATLKGIDCTIKGGSIVGIVGETGSGKSSLLKLLPRLLKVSDGSIEIDHQDIQNVTLTRYVVGCQNRILGQYQTNLTILVFAKLSARFLKTI
jgi:ABC-type multidrug transport system fused ATPase/permease subunit